MNISFGVGEDKSTFFSLPLASTAQKRILYMIASFTFHPRRLRLPQKQECSKTNSTIIRARWEIYIVFFRRSNEFFLEREKKTDEMNGCIEIQYVHYRNGADKTSYHTHFSLPFFLFLFCVLWVSQIKTSISNHFPQSVLDSDSRFSFFSSNMGRQKSCGGFKSRKLSSCYHQKHFAVSIFWSVFYIKKFRLIDCSLLMTFVLNVFVGFCSVWKFFFRRD